MNIALIAVGGAAFVLAAYGVLIRPTLMHWGATRDEVTGDYPGAEIVPGGTRAATMAITIDAPPHEVWPWLVQMGSGRGGWYTWDLLDNGGHPSAREVHPEWQQIAVGDMLKFCPMSRVQKDAYAIAVIEPDRFLGLHGLSDVRGRFLDFAQPRPSSYMEGLWGFQLKELPGDRTRLVIGGYEMVRPLWLKRFVFYWFFIPVVWIMQAHMMKVLKRNIERAGSQSRTRGSSEAA